jgi:hypothetical protein
MIGTGMFQINDTDTRLTLTLVKDARPRNPRLVEDNVFHLVTWTRGLGDPHGFLSRKAFLDAFPAETTAIFPVRKMDTARGPVLVRVYSDKERIAGYAFATFERLCIEFGLECIDAEIRDDTMEEAENICLGELQAYDEFVSGEVYRYEIVDRRGETVETRRDLYGEEYARHLAQQAFDRHMMTVHTGG